jgi:CheY-like chemotaxis protein
MGNGEGIGRVRPAETILVVDDDVRVLALTGEMLRLAGYKVLKVNVAPEAVLLFERSAPEIDLLLSDVQMPSLTGPELAVKLRQRNPSLPVVFMSGCAANRCPPGTLRKPFKMADLWSTVSEALNDALATTSGHASSIKPEA